MRLQLRTAFAWCALVSAGLAACDSQSGGGAAASASPAPSYLVNGIAVAHPSSSCDRKGKDFLWYFTGNGQSGTFPYPIEGNYSPEPNSNWYAFPGPGPSDTPPAPPGTATPIAYIAPVPVQPSGNVGWGTNYGFYVPTIDTWAGFQGTEDKISVIGLPSGKLSDDYRYDQLFLVKRAADARATMAAVQAGMTFAPVSPTPVGATPMPTDSMDAWAAWDQDYKNKEEAAVNSLMLQVGDDKDLFGYELGSFLPPGYSFHAMTCYWMNSQPYDLYLLLQHKEKLPDDQASAMASTLAQDNANSDDQSGAQYATTYTQIFWAHYVMPEPLKPDDVTQQDTRDSRWDNLQGANWQALTGQIPVPNVNDTSTPYTATAAP